MNSTVTTGLNERDEHTMAIWTPRRALTLDAARCHTRNIKYFRQLLYIFALMIIAPLVWFFTQTPTRIVPNDNPDEALKMVNPVYKGRTPEGLPFRITADEAIRLIGSPKEMQLSNPVLHYLRGAGLEESIVVALSGTYDNENDVVELKKEVNLKTDDGYTCDTNHARVFVKAKRIEGDNPVECYGGFGHIRGQAYEINDNYSEFVFKNGMTAHLISEKTNDTSALQGLR